MNVICTKNYLEASKKAAQIIHKEIRKNPEAVLGLATGDSPIGIYRELIRMHKEEQLSFKKVTTVNLDEYKGLAYDDVQSYRYFMNTQLFNHIDIDKHHTFVPNGLAVSDEDACAQYDQIIEMYGPIDVQLLGIGHNGHIGFNEPNDIFVKHTNCISLKDCTIEANSRLFSCKEDVPTQAYTMGLLPIMMAKHIIVIVCGKGKADIVNKVINGEITPHVPASILQLHQNVTFIADDEALSLSGIN